MGIEAAILEYLFGGTNMAVTNQTKNSASTFANSAKSGFTLFGDLPLNDSRIVNLTFDDTVPSTYKTLKEMEFDDYINTTSLTNQAKNNV